MRKYTKLSVQWFYELLERGECDIMDFKEQLEDKNIFGKPLKNFAPNYEEMARDVVAFANRKGGFLFLGISDKSKEVNRDFVYTEEKIFDLIKQIQDRTQPTITLRPHKLTIDGTKLLVLEIPFSMQMHSTSRGEYLIRSNNGNKPIEPHEMATIMSEKSLIVYDQKSWKIKDWQDEDRTKRIYNKIKTARADSPLLKETREEFNDILNFEKEEQGVLYPTTTGILLAGNNKSLKEFPYSEIKYVRYFEDGSYKPYEWKGNLIEIADNCFAQLKSEIQQKELSFGLFHEFIEDYSEVVLRELLINAIVHRDYSRQQVIEIRKYPSYLEIESPGMFPEGVDETNFLRKTNPRNPNIIDVFRAIKYAEKAGSGFDKIFADLLSKGKKLPTPTVTATSILFRIDAEICSDKLIELSLQYKQLEGKDMDMEKLLVLNEIINRKKISFLELEEAPFISKGQLRRVISELHDLEFVETTGKTSGLKYILHKTKSSSTAEKIKYSQLKKQEKARQKEAILRYLDDIDVITNSEARQLLKLTDNDVSYVSRLFREMLENNDIEIVATGGNNKNVYGRKRSV
ncbi:MAG: putative DNA binding domain-containing protein [Fermentimonas sp.]|jgi:ATP-dependent DNA helicase RecG|nr:putative DNA binding domain-containing protein [Fermentimonas sp.]MDD4404466.1 putative DNA binding domain-containing protein [Parabacteroides sp.]